MTLDYLCLESTLELVIESASRLYSRRGRKLNSLPGKTTDRISAVIGSSLVLIL
jgi:hypothetical protein